MKRIITIAVILGASLQIASAQSVKSPAAAKASVEKAIQSTRNPKQAGKPAPWFNLAKAYMDAYESPSGNLIVGAALQDLQMYGFKEEPLSTGQVNVSGQRLTKNSYKGKNLYFNESGQLLIIEITEPLYENCLDSAFTAMQQAFLLDVKGSKVKDYKAMQESIVKKCSQEAYDAYSLQNIKKASSYFELGYEVSEAEPLAKIDSNCVYNAAFTAWMLEEYDRARTLFEKCLSIDYFGEEGETYAKLADIAEKQGDSLARKQYLEEAFVKFPQSQSILIGLINFYLSGDGNTDRLFELLNAAKANEPNNASLYYVEGNIHAQLGHVEQAVASYEQCAKINPTYAYGFIGEGQMYYNIALEVQDKASAEMDDAKYMKLVGELEAALKACIVPFEKAYEIVGDKSVKVAVAEYLKNACFRFRTESKEMSDKYKMYDEYVAANR